MSRCPQGVGAPPCPPILPTGYEPCACATLDRLDRYQPQVFYQSNLFLEERFAVFHARQHAIEVGHGGDAFTNLSVGREIIVARRLIAELLFVGVDGFEFGLEFVGDVHDKCRANVEVERSVDDLEWAMRLETA